MSEDDDDDFYNNFETFLSEKNSSSENSSTKKLDSNNWSNDLVEKVVETSTVNDDLLMADIDKCLDDENEVRKKALSNV